MLRSDREIKDPMQIKAFLERSSVIRVAFNTDATTAPYVVPLSFGFDYDEKENNLTFYFHGASRGRKLELAQKNPNVGFELDNALELVTADNACSFSLKYESIIGDGEICIVDEPKEKKECLNKVMYQFTTNNDWQYVDAMIDKTTVFKLIVNDFAMKKN